MVKAILLAAMVSTSSHAVPTTESFPWTNWNQLKTEVPAGGHDGECSGVGHVQYFNITRGEAGPDFQMWNIMTPVADPSRWAAVKFVGVYAEPSMIFIGTITNYYFTGQYLDPESSLYYYGRGFIMRMLDDLSRRIGLCRRRGVLRA